MYSEPWLGTTNCCELMKDSEGSMTEATPLPKRAKSHWRRNCCKNSTEGTQTCARVPGESSQNKRMCLAAPTIPFEEVPVDVVEDCKESTTEDIDGMNVRGSTQLRKTFKRHGRGREQRHCTKSWLVTPCMIIKNDRSLNVCDDQIFIGFHELIIIGSVK